jgi:Dyp-type peroxidase family
LKRDKPKLDSDKISAAIDAKGLTTKVADLMTGLGTCPVIARPSILLPILGGRDVARQEAAVAVADGTGAASDGEPIYDAQQRANIQGNSIPGFNKDHQHFLFLRIGSIAACKKWLRKIAPQISSLDEVLAFVRAHRSLRLRMGVKEPPLTSCWVNIAFSHEAIAKLAGKNDADMFSDLSFRQGLSERSTYLGDPSNEKTPGHRRHWVVGGPKNAAEILVIVAADDPSQLNRTVNAVRSDAIESKLKPIFEQRGDSLPGDLRGHEHFGFKDGISQPGIRGRVSTAPDDYITPRYLDPSDPRSQYFAKPGQVLLWPGEFLLGENRQDPENLTAPAPPLPATHYPAWARLGSYVVCRRLLQNVPAFWQFSNVAAQALGIDPQQFASMLVGRWPSGAPIMRSPTNENPSLAADDWANNHFLYDDNTRPSNLVPISGYSGDDFPQAQADVLGAVCPHFAHIRKMNPRDMATDLGKPHDTMVRMILRRGIPFGRPVIGVKRPSKSLIKEERGLMFLCYGATIEEQFEFLSRRWANSPIQPNAGGHDPIIGQADDEGARDRFIEFPTKTGLQRIPLPRDWVIPSGGGYFFSPPIQALTDVLGT